MVGGLSVGDLCGLLNEHLDSGNPCIKRAGHTGTHQTFNGFWWLDSRPVHSSLMSEPEVTLDRLEAVRALHHPLKVWESDRAYSLTCRSCLTVNYPCPTAELLAEIP